MLTLVNTNHGDADYSFPVCAGRCCQNNGLLTTRPKGSVHHLSDWSCFYSNPSSGFRLWGSGYIRGMSRLVIICVKITACMCSVLHLLHFFSETLVAYLNINVWPRCKLNKRFPARISLDSYQRGKINHKRRHLFAYILLIS